MALERSKHFFRPNLSEMLEAATADMKGGFRNFQLKDHDIRRNFRGP